MDDSGTQYIPPARGFHYITSLPDDEQFVGIVTFRDQVFVASSKGVYVLSDDKLVPIKIEWKDD
jgi:hypothetical protein